jgi:hypothetical protein
VTWRIESEHGTPLAVGIPTQEEAGNALAAFLRIAARDDVPEAEKQLADGARVVEEHPLDPPPTGPGPFDP